MPRPSTKLPPRHPNFNKAVVPGPSSELLLFDRKDSVQAVAADLALSHLRLVLQHTTEETDALQIRVTSEPKDMAHLLTLV